MGIDFTDAYLNTKEEKYLKKAQLIWKFIESGADDKLGGGIYWCEQKKVSKNTCSNAPASVFALKMFKAIRDSSYLIKGQELYEWTKKNCKIQPIIYTLTISLWMGKLISLNMPTIVGK